MIVYWFCGFKSHRAPSFFKKGFLIQTSIQTLISFTKTNKRESQENKLRLAAQQKDHSHIGDLYYNCTPRPYGPKL